MSNPGGRLEIDFETVSSFRLLVSYMIEFTKENVIMVVNKREIKLLYEEANRGRVYGTFKFDESIRSIIVNNVRLNDYFIMEFKLECLKQAIDTMIDKHNIKLELKDNEYDNILSFRGCLPDCYERSVSKFRVNLPSRCIRINPPSFDNWIPMNFHQSDLDKLLKMAELFSNIKDNLLVSVQHSTDYHIFKIKYSHATGSKVCHQIKYKREDQADGRASDAAAVKPRLIAAFFRLTRLNKVSCSVKHDNSILLEAENEDEQNIGIKVYLKGLSEVINN